MNIGISKLATALIFFGFSTYSYADIFICTAESASITSLQEVVNLSGGGSPEIIDTDRGIRGPTSEEYIGSCRFYPSSFPENPFALWACTSAPGEHILGLYQIVIWDTNQQFALSITNPNATIVKVGSCENI